MKGVEKVSGFKISDDRAWFLATTLEARATGLFAIGRLAEGQRLMERAHELKKRAVTA